MSHLSLMLHKGKKVDFSKEKKSNMNSDCRKRFHKIAYMFEISLLKLYTSVTSLYADAHIRSFHPKAFSL